MNRVPTYRPAYLASDRKDRDRHYDQSLRDRQSKAFYNSHAWKTVRKSKLRQDPLCEDCKARGVLIAASHVHHAIKISEDQNSRLDLDNLVSLCHSCHSRLHASEK